MFGLSLIHIYYNKENTRCVAKLYQCVKDKCDDENHKFFVSVELIGVFEIVGPVTDEDKKEIHVRTYQQVFPYAEVLVKQVCAAGGMPNFMLLRHKMDPDHRYFKCPNCGQQMRVPRGKGRITVHCRSCGATFEEKS